jgi:hypothetical protein
VQLQREMGDYDPEHGNPFSLKLLGHNNSDNIYDQFLTAVDFEGSTKEFISELQAAYNAVGIAGFFHVFGCGQHLFSFDAMLDIDRHELSNKYQMMLKSIPYTEIAEFLAEDVSAMAVVLARNNL